MSLYILPGEEGERRTETHVHPLQHYEPRPLNTPLSVPFLSFLPSESRDYSNSATSDVGLLEGNGLKKNIFVLKGERLLK